jgi:glycosyltransferase involved in cell wall biosynthesis
VNVEDASALAQKAAELLALPNDKWKSISEAAEETARRYSWEDATTLFERALLQIAGVARKA